MIVLRKARLLFCFANLFNISFIYAKSLVEIKCNQLNSTTLATRFFQSSCLTLSIQTYTYDQAKATCNQFSNGHLVLPTKAVGDVMLEMMAQLAGNICWVGLRQKVTGSEPEGDWYWEAKDSVMFANQNATNWFPNEPDNSGGDGEDCAAMGHTGQILDVLCDTGANFMAACQYRDEQVMFKKLEGNKRGINDTLVSEQISATAIRCATECAHSPFCTAFSYSTTTKECFLYINAETTVQEEGYDIYTII